MSSTAAVLFFGTAFFAVFTLGTVRSLHVKKFAELFKINSLLVSLLTAAGFVVLFIPLVIWTSVAFPAAAVVPGVLALVFTISAYRQSEIAHSPRVLALATASSGTWFLYGFFEYEMQQWAKTVVAPIRADLLILAPLLYAATLSVVRFLSSTAQNTRRTDA